MGDVKRKWFCPDGEREAGEDAAVLFIDPGLKGTGWAFFPRIYRKAAKKTAGLPAQSGVLHAKDGGHWIARAEEIRSAFRGVLAAVRPQWVVIEQPMLWLGSATSQASATHAKAGEPGDLFKLAFLVGLLSGVVRDATNANAVLVMPHEWKGQLAKDHVLERLADFGLKPKDHEADAMGMGLAAQGVL